MTGTVTHIEIEGGFWGIRADDGSKYVPVNLADEFKRDGLKVEFEPGTEHLMGAAQWGRAIRLVSVRRLD